MVIKFVFYSKNCIIFICYTPLVMSYNDLKKKKKILGFRGEDLGGVLIKNFARKSDTYKKKMN